MVHWDQEKIKRRLLAKLAALMAVAGVVIAMTDHGDQAATDQAALTIVESAALPLVELSGATVVPLPDGRREILAVSDNVPALVAVPLDAHDALGLPAAEVRDFRQPLLDRFALCGSQVTEHCRDMAANLTSQWEAIAVDGLGRVFLAQETTNSVVVLAKDLKTVEAVLAFDFFRARDGRRHKPGKRGGSSLAEGLILLKNGHFLVAKESFPAVIVEFGPKDDAPLGLAPATLLGAEPFKLASGDTRPREMTALATWTRAGDDGACDQSEIAATADGRLYVLSQKCKHILAFAGLDPATGTVAPQKAWSLPRQILHPEALVPLADGAFLVGSDAKGKHANLFRVVER